MFYSRSRLMHSYVTTRNWDRLPPAVIVTLGGNSGSSRILCQRPLLVAGHEGYCRISAAVREIRGSVAESAEEEEKEAIAEALFREFNENAASTAAVIGEGNLRKISKVSAASRASVTVITRRVEQAADREGGGDSIRESVIHGWWLCQQIN